MENKDGGQWVKPGQIWYVFVSDTTLYGYWMPQWTVEVCRVESVFAGERLVEVTMHNPREVIRLDLDNLALQVAPCHLALYGFGPEQPS